MLGWGPPYQASLCAFPLLRPPLVLSLSQLPPKYSVPPARRAPRPGTKSHTSSNGPSSSCKYEFWTPRTGAGSPSSDRFRRKKLNPLSSAELGNSSSVSRLRMGGKAAGPGRRGESEYKGRVGISQGTRLGGERSLPFRMGSGAFSRPNSYHSVWRNRNPPGPEDLARLDGRGEIGATLCIPCTRLTS